jgi:RecB family exonuclease
MDAAGREVARSAFVDEAAAVLARSRGIEDDDDALEKVGVLERIPTNEALVSGFPVANDSAAIVHARSVSARENARTLERGAWNGLIEDPALKTWLEQRYGESFVWSATQLEQVAKCRWHWFAQRLLRLDPRGDPDDLMEPTVRGSLMHDALNRFFTAAKGKMGGPVYLLDDGHGEWAALMSASLKAAWDSAEAKEQWLGPVALRQVVRSELEAELLGYLEFEIEWNVKSAKANTTASKQVRTGFVEGEVRFDDVALSADGVSFRLRGSIDRVDRGIDDRIASASRYIAAIDYKSTEYSTPAAGKKEGWDDGVVLQVPLYAAALQHLRPDDLVARMEYRSIRKPKPIHTLSLAPVKAGAVQDAPDAEEKLAKALDDAARRVTEIRRGELPANPAPSCGCSPYCPARDICRIPGGPVDLGR